MLFTSSPLHIHTVTLAHMTVYSFIVGFLDHDLAWNVGGRL